MSDAPAGDAVRPRQEGAAPPPADWLLPGVSTAFLAAVALSLGVLFAVGQSLRHQAEGRALQLASAVAHEFGERLDRSLSSAYALATLLRQGRGHIDNFEGIANEMIDLYGGISALQLAPDGVVTHVVPLAGNEAVIGFSPLTDAVQGPEARRAIAERRLALAGPFELRQGDVGVVGRYPVFLADEKGGEERFWGMTQVLVRIPDLLAVARLDSLVGAGYAYELWRVRPDDGVRQVFASGGGALGEQPVLVHITVPNGRWSLSLAPIGGWHSPLDVAIGGFVALVFSLLVALAVYLLLRQPRLLHAEVARRTEALRRRSQLLQSVLAHFPGGVSVMDADLRVVEWNEEFRRLLDFPRELFSRDATPFADFIRYNAERGEYGEVDPDSYVAEALADASRPVPHHFERTRPNGTVLEVRGTPLPDGGFVTSYTDVTERKRAEARLLAANQRYEQLTAELEARVAERTQRLEAEVEERRLAEAAVRRSAEWLREIIETMSGGILLWDRHQRLAAWNDGFRRLYPASADLLRVGIPREELRAGMKARNEFLGADGDSADWNYLGQWERRQPNGTIIRCERLATSEGGRLVIQSDITAMRRTDEVLARNERMASLGSLVAGVAHEINTPIGNALMVASALGHRIGEFNEALAAGPLRRSVLDAFIAGVRESGDLLERNLLRAANLIQNFKQVAVDQTSDRRRIFDLATVLDEVRMTLLPRFKHGSHRLEFEAEVGVQIDGYPGALGQVVANLVENALLHAFDGRTQGTVSIHAATQEDGRVRLSIADDGNGIAPELLSRVFDPFFTTRLGKGGSGLGLSIVLNLVRNLLGGEIAVDSQPGQGCRFIITLPTVAPAQIDGEPAVHPEDRG
ncbi:MAG: PAS-domain containing protein [Azospira sp.]|jgi:signal transduction histidine kinase/sensor domain CHASE-containing protein|nr:PAS-domain containing protein [Azospira sp.]